VFEVTTVPPAVEISVPFSIEFIEISIGIGVHLFEGLMEEVVQLVAAVIVAASFTWAWLFALFSDGIVFVCWVKATTVFISRVAASSEGWGAVLGWNSSEENLSWHW